VIVLKVEGDQLFNQPKFRAANFKYQEALNKSSFPETKAIFGNLSQKAKLELLAVELK
jgi:hypothetical protein